MRHDWTSRGLWLTAAVALVCGALMTGATLRGLDDRAERREAKRAQLRELAGLKASLQPYQVAFESHMERKQAAPPSVETLRTTIEGLPAPDDVRRATRELADEWQAVQKTFVFNRAPLSRVMAFVQAAEAAAPPWNLVRCDIRALSRDEAGVTAVTIELETLQGPSH